MLQLENIRVQRNDTNILDQINLTVHKGDKIWIHGPSGSGKSTLLKVLFHAEYFTGRLLFHDLPVSSANLDEYRSQMSFIAQRIPDFDLRAGDVLRYPFHFRANRRRGFPAERAEELLYTMGFEPKVLDRFFSDLSGGEKQRLMVLTMLLINRPVFLLDEVTAALDPQNIDTVVRLLTASPDHTIISVSHNKEWRTRANRVLFMEAGRLREIG